MATTTTTHKHDAYTQGTFPCACRIDYDRDGIAAVTYCPTHAHAFAMLATLRQIAYSDPSRGMHDKARAMVQTVEG